MMINHLHSKKIFSSISIDVKDLISNEFDQGQKRHHIPKNRSCSLPMWMKDNRKRKEQATQRRREKKISYSFCSKKRKRFWRAICDLERTISSLVYAERSVISTEMNVVFSCLFRLFHKQQPCLIERIKWRWFRNYPPLLVRLHLID